MIPADNFRMKPRAIKTLQRINYGFSLKKSSEVVLVTQYILDLEKGVRT